MSARQVLGFIAVTLVTTSSPAEPAEPEPDAAVEARAEPPAEPPAESPAEPPVEPPAEPPVVADRSDIEPSLAAPKRDLSDPKSIEPALKKALEIPGGFCKTPDYELSFGEMRVCALADAAKERCPALAVACARYQIATSGDERGSRARGDRRRGEERTSDRASSGSPLGELFGGLIELVFWALLVVGVGAMLYAALKALVARSRGSKADDDALPGATTTAVPRPPITGSPEALLERSRKLAETGELKGAMALVLGALLRHLEIDGRLELHPSRTNGDYVRSLRRQGHDARELKGVAGEVEAVEFGGASASRERFSALYERVLKLVHVAGMVLFCVLPGMLCGCREHSPPPSSVSSCGTDAAGYSALCNALEARGLEIHRRFTAVEYIPKAIDTVVVLEDDLDDEERMVLLQWAERGGNLVLFDGATRFREHLTPSETCTDGVTLLPSTWNVPDGATLRFGFPGMRAFAHALGGLVPVACGKWPVVAVEDTAEGAIVAVADWRFATNASLAIGDNAALAASLVGVPGASVELVGSWTGTGTDLPVESLSRSGLVPWFLQVLLFGFVFALYRGSPFGSRREPVSVTRRAFAEHALALGDAYSRARASRLALVHFGSWALERLRVRLATTKQGRLTDLAGAVAARHSVSEAEVMSLVVAVRSAEDQAHDSATEAEHLAALRRLAALVKKTGAS